MNPQVDRRNFLRSTGIGLCTLLGGSSVASGEWKKRTSGDPGKYDVYETDEAWDKDFLFANWANPGGLMSGRKDFNPDYFMYFTKSENNGNTYLHNTRPSVGLNPFGKNGFRLRASPGKEIGEMHITFNSRTSMGGFRKIANNREAVRISVEAGEVSISRDPNWSFPVVQWDNYAGRAPTGDISTGNIYIQIRDGRVTSVNDKAMSPLVYGSTPFYLRSPRTEDLFIGKNGKVIQAKNIVR